MPSEASLRGGSRYLIEGTRLSKLSFVLGKRTKGRLGTGISRGFSLYPSDMDDAKADFLTLYSSPLLSQTTGRPCQVVAFAKDGLSLVFFKVLVSLLPSRSSKRWLAFSLLNLSS